RRRSQLERGEHAAEPCLHRLPAVAGDLEGLVHNLGSMVADRPARELDAVADDIVLESLYRQRILRLKGFESALRHRERVVAELDFAGLLIELVHGIVDDPAEPEFVLRHQPELPANVVTGKAGEARGGSRLVADEEDGVARAGTSGLAHDLQPPSFQEPGD